MRTLLTLLVMPLAVGLLAGFAGLILRRTWPTLVGLGMLFLFGLPATGRFLLGGLESATPRLEPNPKIEADTAVVLGGYLRTDPHHPEGGDEVIFGRAERLQRGLQLLRQGRIRRLILCAGPPSPSDFTATVSEGERARGEALRQGFPPDKVLLAPPAANTAEEARVVRGILGPDADVPLILITSAFHMPRALLAFRRAGLQVLPHPCDYHVYFRRPPGGWRALDWIPNAEGLYQSSLALKELYGMAFYRYIDPWLSGALP